MEAKLIKKLLTESRMQESWWELRKPASPYYSVGAPVELPSDSPEEAKKYFLKLHAKDKAVIDNIMSGELRPRLIRNRNTWSNVEKVKKLIDRWHSYDDGEANAAIVNVTSGRDATWYKIFSSLPEDLQMQVRKLLIRYENSPTREQKLLQVAADYDKR
jgi:hypothetical protein